MSNILFSFIIMILLSGISSKSERYSKYRTFLQWVNSQNFTTNKIHLNFTNTHETYVSNAEIEKDEIIMSIPKKLFISFNHTLNLTTLKMQSKYSSFLTNKDANQYFFDNRIKRQSFLAAIFSQAQLKQKGKVFKYLSPYLTFIRETYDTYPIFFSEDITNLIKSTHLGRLIIKGKESLNEEYNYMTNVLHIKMDPDTYTIHRVLGEAQTKIIEGEQFIVPLPDLIRMNPSEYNVIEEYDKKNEVMVLKAARAILIGEVIELQSHIVDNTLNFMYYGKTFHGGMKIHYPISVLHKRLIEKYRRIDANKNDELLKDMQETFDIGKDNYLENEKVIEKYGKMAKAIEYNTNDDNKLIAYQLLMNNLVMYKEDYDKIKDSDYYHIVISEENMINIKRVIDSEKRLIDKRINKLKDIIANLKASKLENDL